MGSISLAIKPSPPRLPPVLGRNDQSISFTCWRTMRQEVCEVDHDADNRGCDLLVFAIGLIVLLTSTEERPRCTGMTSCFSG